VSQKSKDLFVKNNIFNAVELDARYEIMQEIYVKKIDIEAKILAQLATSHIIPSAIEYQGKLASNVASLKAAGLSKSLYDVQVNSITEIAKHVKVISDSVTKLINESDKAHHIEDTHKKAISMCHKVKPLFDTIRKSSDALEFMIEDDLWKLPKYRELLFVK